MSIDLLNSKKNIKSKKRGSDNNINVSASFIVNSSARSVNNLDVNTNRSLMFLNNFNKFNNNSNSPKNSKVRTQQNTSLDSEESDEFYNIEKSDKFSNLVDFLQDKLQKALQKKNQTRQKYCRQRSSSMLQLNTSGRHY